MKKNVFFLLACFLLVGCVHSGSLAVDADKNTTPGTASVSTQGTAENSAAATKDSTPAVRKRIGLVAHDARKPELLAWVKAHASRLATQELFCTGTTGKLVAKTLEKALPGKPFSLTRFHSGPLGGDQQMGALIAENGLDILVFFVDPMSSHPHAADIQALMRLSQVYNIVVATTPATADYVISSPLLPKAYTTNKPEYSSYINRKTP